MTLKRTPPTGERTLHTETISAAASYQPQFVAIPTTVDVVTIKPNHCKRCGLHYDDCKSPVAHSVPTINNIKLPGRIEAISAKYGRGLTSKLLTAREREIFDANPVLGVGSF